MICHPDFIRSWKCDVCRKSQRSEAFQVSKLRLKTRYRAILTTIPPSVETSKSILEPLKHTLRLCRVPTGLYTCNSCCLLARNLFFTHQIHGCGGRTCRPIRLFETDYLSLIASMIWFVYSKSIYSFIILYCWTARKSLDFTSEQRDRSVKLINSHCVDIDTEGKGLSRGNLLTRSSRLLKILEILNRYVNSSRLEFN